MDHDSMAPLEKLFFSIQVYTTMKLYMKAVLWHACAKRSGKFCGKQRIASYLCHSDATHSQKQTTDFLVFKNTVPLLPSLFDTGSLHLFSVEHFSTTFKADSAVFFLWNFISLALVLVGLAFVTLFSSSAVTWKLLSSLLSPHMPLWHEQRCILNCTEEAT